MSPRWRLIFMSVIELSFPIQGCELPTDHGYPLYAALSRGLPDLHQALDNFSIGPIVGTHLGQGKLQLDEHSALRVRLSPESIPRFLPLAGKRLVVQGQSLRLGVPEVRAPQPAVALAARLVTIKGFCEPGPFLEAARRKLVEHGIDAELGLALRFDGPHQGQPCRRILTIHDRRVVGFGVIVQGLTAASSLWLLEHGLGGRRRMGCGFFVPFQEAR